MNTNIRTMLCALMVIVILTALMGCTVLNVVSDIKGQKDVLDVSIIFKDSTIFCDVILNNDAKVTNAEGLCKAFALQIKTHMPYKEIILRLLQNKSVIASYSIEHD